MEVSTPSLLAGSADDRVLGCSAGRGQVEQLAVVVRVDELVLRSSTVPVTFAPAMLEHRDHAVDVGLRLLGQTRPAPGAPASLPASTSGADLRWRTPPSG